MTDGIIQQWANELEIMLNDHWIRPSEFKQKKQELIEKIKQEFENKNRDVTALPMTTLKEIKENLIGDNQE